MEKDEITRQYPGFVAELHNEFAGQKQGYVKIIKIGKKIFPYSIPPRIEVVLLDPEDEIVGFRLASDPEARDRKKGPWTIGDPIDVVKATIDWADRMKKLKR